MWALSGKNKYNDDCIDYDNTKSDFINLKLNDCCYQLENSHEYPSFGCKNLNNKFSTKFLVYLLLAVDCLFEINLNRLHVVAMENGRGHECQGCERVVKSSAAAVGRKLRTSFWLDRGIHWQGGMDFWGFGIGKFFACCLHIKHDSYVGSAIKCQSKVMCGLMPRGIMHGGKVKLKSNRFSN